MDFGLAFSWLPCSIDAQTESFDNFDPSIPTPRSLKTERAHQTRPNQTRPPCMSKTGARISIFYTSSKVNGKLLVSSAQPHAHIWDRHGRLKEISISCRKSRKP
ncbi:uncharacterized protein BDW47DRAFT_111890 [Aspergillus candidus]|uniref:Uncharacterized protein n=1 Tax=Aspergillus candidus TaxID=41067 RepID=A0A2I2F1Q7_ASPCN|nr:hypothetical protein BDW47DRAFT_111890 [Aspergillus candidus]PLB34572.1 hypothetical protein BDW47DRAFT_111890 [Aspergillus candidus]